MTTALHTVHVRINDAGTGQPVPARVRFTTADGQYHAPFGRLAEFATGRNQDVGGNVRLGLKPHAYIDGQCEINLPAGPVRVEVSHGPEYLPIDQEAVLGPGQLALRLSLSRWTNLRDQGWYSGDTRAHFLTPHAALLEGAAEDLAVVNLLASESRVRGPYGKEYPSTPNLLAFSGQRPALERPGHLVVVNTQNCHPALGSLGLLNCHRVVYPLRFGGPDGWDDWSLADWCDQCHRKGGLATWTRTWHESAAFRYGEPLADLVLGKIDAFEIDFFEDSPFDALPDWYRLLNAGLRVPLVGGSGKDSNDLVLGSMRTYAHLGVGKEFTYQNWIEAIRAGRTFITNGPLISLTVDGMEPGAALDLSTETIRVHAEARGMMPLDWLEVVLNGQVVGEASFQGSPAAVAVLDTEVQAPSGGWLAVRCGSTHQLLSQPGNQRVFAHTSPVYLQRAGHSAPIDAAALALFIRDLDHMLEWTASQGRFANDRQRERLAGIFRAAQQKLIERRPAAK